MKQSVTEKLVPGAFPESLFEGDSTWGEWDLCDESEANDRIAKLLEIGEDWTDISLADCTEYTLHTVIDSDRAAYVGGMRHDGYYKNCREYAYIYSLATNSFTEQMDSINDFKIESFQE